MKNRKNNSNNTNKTMDAMSTRTGRIFNMYEVFYNRCGKKMSMLVDSKAEAQRTRDHIVHKMRRKFLGYRPITLVEA